MNNVIRFAMRTVEEIFEAFGGPAAFARHLEIKGSTASEMKRRRSITIEHWPKLIAAARSLNIEISNDDLVAIHVREREGEAV